MSQFSCARGLIELGRVLRVAVNSCVLESKQVGRVLAGCDFRSVIWQLC
jgi:hypothetical protein